LFEEVLECEGVHDRTEHPHVVGARTIHSALTKFRAAEEVSTTDDYGNLYFFGCLGNIFCNLGDHVWIYTQGSGTEGFT
jgi:hypothetical protein